MKVAILGGTGVFGSRLARLLARDGHALILASRRGGGALAEELGAATIALDRDGDLAPLFAMQPDILIDAAGPFQAYAEPRVARACIAARVPYLDLSDDAGFCQSVIALDADAKAAGVGVLTGVSSVPALSSAAVAELSAGMTRIEAIDSAILPGNRAPRGRSVMEAILAQVGRPVRLWLGGAWENRPGWSDPRTYRLPGGIRRRGWLIGAPDLALFPDAYGTRTVVFRAGLELPIMGISLAILSHIRRFIPLPVPVGPLQLVAGWLEGFGTDKGGMSVNVTGRDGAGWVKRTWRLVAEAGDGPFIPATPARALLRQGLPAPGARAALNDVPLDRIVAAMEDLAVRTERDEERITPLFETVVDGFAALPDAVRESHQTIAVTRLEGQGRVTRGKGLWPRLIAAVMRFPPAGEDIPVTVIKTRTERGETWERRFGRHVFRSHLAAENGAMTERFGLITFTLGLTARDGGLEFPVTGARLGPLKLPRALLPVSEARETAPDGRFRFDVTLRAPLTGQFIIRYEGHLAPVE
ncbi:DUF4166 domain-containing protein [Rhodobacterales bacterium HKCCE3408]|nr:DUF4166 domain-containing protein [Rhodobacterales bacterium HKCCE3408]